MKPPRSVVIGPYRIEIKVVPEDNPNLGPGEHDGRYISNDQVVYIRRGQSPISERDTVVHELDHALLSISGAGYELSPTDTEEQLVRRTGPWRLALLRDNPRLVEYLTEAC